MKTRVIVGVAVSGILAVALWYGLASQPDKAGSQRPSPNEPAQRPSVAVAPDLDQAPAESSASHAETESEELHARSDTDIDTDHDHQAVEDPTGDLALYDRHPMSLIPHHVARGWGAGGAGDVPGVVGAYVIVAPDITDEAITKLARDIRDYHRDAIAVSVRILDLEAAATYDRHSDGGALAAAHLVGLVNVNTRLDMERITIRGRVIEP